MCGTCGCGKPDEPAGHEHAPVEHDEQVAPLLALDALHSPPGAPVIVLTHAPPLEDVLAALSFVAELYKEESFVAIDKARAGQRDSC